MSLWFFDMVSTHERPLQRKFLAPRCSSAYFFCLLTLVIALVVPFIASYGTGAFWEKVHMYHEQPTVQYADEYFLMLDGATASSRKMYSTVTEANQAYGGTTAPTVTVNVDDGEKAKKINMVVKMPMSDNAVAEVQQVTLHSVFKCDFDDKVHVKMSGLGSIDASTHRGASGVTLFTRLNFVQETPLPVTHSDRILYEASPLAYSSSANTDPFKIEDLLSAYYERSETLLLEPLGAPIWDYTPATDFTINLHVKIPHAGVEYDAPTPELLKFAWIQYLAFLIPVWLLLMYLKDFIYGAQLLPSRVVFEGAPKPFSKMA